MTGKRPHPPGDEPEMTFESPDTVYIPEDTGDDLPRRPGGLGAVAVGTAGFVASSAMDPGSTSAADDPPAPDRSTFDESLDVFDTLGSTGDPDPMSETPPASSDALDSVYGAETSAGGGFNLTESDPDLDFSPIDFSTPIPSPTDPPPTADVTTGATSTAGSTSPTFEQPDLVQALDDSLDGLDVAEMDEVEDDGDEEDLGG